MPSQQLQLASTRLMYPQTARVGVPPSTEPPIVEVEREPPASARKPPTTVEYGPRSQLHGRRHRRPLEESSWKFFDDKLASIPPPRPRDAAPTCGALRLVLPPDSVDLQLQEIVERARQGDKLAQENPALPLSRSVASSAGRPTPLWDQRKGRVVQVGASLLASHPIMRSLPPSVICDVSTSKSLKAIPSSTASMTPPVASTTEITMPSVAGNLVQAPVPSTHSEGCAANEFPWDQNPPVALGEVGANPASRSCGEAVGCRGYSALLRNPLGTGRLLDISEPAAFPPIADIAATLTPAERLQLIRRDANAPLAYCGGGVSIDTSREMHAAALLREERRATLCSAKLETTSVPQDIIASPYTHLQRIGSGCLDTLHALVPLCDGESRKEEENLDEIVALHHMYTSLHPPAAVSVASAVPGAIATSIVRAEHGGKCAVVNVQHADSALTGPVRQLDYIATQSSRGVLLGSHLPSDPAARLAYLRERQRVAEDHFSIRKGGPSTMPVPHSLPLSPASSSSTPRT